jgi:hypothetical protein
MLIVSANCVTSYGRQASPQTAKPPAGSQAQILQQCREAVLELKMRRESEDLLKKQVDELKRVSDLKDQRLDVLERTIAEYEKAIAARQRAEQAVELLKQNYEAQIKTVQAELANEKRKNLLWKVVAVGAFVVGIVLGGANN